MNTQVIPTVFIAYPKAFSSREKFERKLSYTLSNLSRFHVKYLSDENNFIQSHILSDKRVCNSINSSCDNLDLSDVSHLVVFNDGESFNELISKAKKKEIKSKIFNARLTKVVNLEKGYKYDVYIGRGTTWGNPHAIGVDGDDRDEVIRKFQYDFDRGLLRFSKKDTLVLKGKTLGCHCKPAPCHGDVIAEYLNSLDDGR